MTLPHLPAKSVIGMVHVGALPATPRAAEPVDTLARRAADEAALMASLGYDAVIIENMHDAPYLLRAVGPEIIAAMARVAAEVRTAVTIPVGIQILAGANHAALAVAHACNLDFIRAEGFVFASVADEGMLHEADAAPLLRYRRTLGAQRIAILADIKKKHSSHAITADIDLAETARAAEFSGADGLIVTGVATGRETSPDDLRAAKNASKLPLFVGSGVTPANAKSMLALADALIVGSSIKHAGDWRNAVHPDRAKALLDAARA